MRHDTAYVPRTTELSMRRLFKPQVKMPFPNAGSIRTRGRNLRNASLESLR